MRVHFLNCISTCPLGGALMDGHGKGLRGRLTCTCLLVEGPSSLILIDTGFGLRDVAAPRARLSPFFLKLLEPEFREEMTAIRQIERLGFHPDDVRDVVLTHLDFDHAGGLDDFPRARVHLLRAERDHALEQKTWLDRQRFRPEQWSTQPNWRVHDPGDGEGWYGFRCVRDLEGLPPEILLIPLRGHTFGHAGVAVRTDARWLLDAGDAYFYHAEMDLQNPRCTPGLVLYQTMMEKDRSARLDNQARLRELRRAASGEVEIFCSHDVREFERHAGRSSHDPPERAVTAAPSWSSPGAEA
ncbi:MAG TPA: MBL fold metallo-hydrolase [Polyangiaceae bacterium]|nr:MBL fold metallo-hydrolase [Polyangiaceae bacterium]